ncbi:MAG: hypothetical protein K1V71_07610, partial [Paramuribaculum sp.]
MIDMIFCFCIGNLLNTMPQKRANLGIFWLKYVTVNDFFTHKSASLAHHPPSAALRATVPAIFFLQHWR